MLGFVELTFSHIGTPDLSTSMIAAPTIARLEALRVERERFGDLRDFVAADLTRPANSNDSGNGTIQLNPDERSEFVFDGIRYLHATYNIRNAQSNGAAYNTARTNLTFLAVSTNNALNQTAVRQLSLPSGAPAPPALALDVLPTDLLTTDGSSLNVAHPDVLQILREPEVAAVPAPPAVTTVFPCGFMVRLVGNTTRRTLPPVPGSDEFDGVVDFAFSIPRQGDPDDPADDPETLSVLMLAVDDSETRLTQGLQEQDTAARAALRQLAAGLNAENGDITTGRHAAGRDRTAHPLRCAYGRRRGLADGAPGERRLDISVVHPRSRKLCRQRRPFRGDVRRSPRRFRAGNIHSARPAEWSCLRPGPAYTIQGTTISTPPAPSSAANSSRSS